MAAQVDAGELEKRVSQCSGLVKMMCGVANNCAISVVRELWISVDLPFDSTIAAVEDFDKDIFRTRGEAKKSIRELTEMREDARKDREEIKAELKNKAV